MATVTLQVNVKPRSKKSSLVQQPDGSWIAQLKSPPTDGKANAELVALIAERFSCRKSDVVIVAGASGRKKLVRIEGA